MHLSWAAVAQGVLVSWPPVLAGIWWGQRRSRAHVEQVTRDQTGQLAEIAAAAGRDRPAGPPAAPPGGVEPG